MSAVQDKLVSYRQMQEADLTEVLQIENEAHLFPWSQGIFLDCLRVGYQCPLMLMDDEILAYGVMSIVAGEAHIFNICVKHSVRGQGFGRRMLRHLLDVAIQKQATTAFLEVRPSNQTALNLYMQSGFAEVGLRKDYYPAAQGKREDAVIMAIDLTNM